MKVISYRYTIYVAKCVLCSLCADFCVHISSQVTAEKPPNVFIWTWWFSSPKTSFIPSLSVFDCYPALALLLLDIASATLEHRCSLVRTESWIIEWADISFFFVSLFVSWNDVTRETCRFNYTWKSHATKNIRWKINDFNEFDTQNTTDSLQTLLKSIECKWVTASSSTFFNLIMDVISDARAWTSKITLCKLFWSINFLQIVWIIFFLEK